MSHLSTIISRVKHKLRVYDGDPKEAAKDSMFRQAIRNLMEYKEVWNDWTPEEGEEADRLYAKYINYVHPKSKGLIPW